MPDDELRLTAYRLTEAPLSLRPAPVERDWMEATGERFAYRCLPLNIANGHGWEILCPVGFAAGWTGGPATDAVVIQTDGGAPAVATSHFGNGILTFHIPLLFRTPPGFDLWVQGPVNRPKDGIYPLTGVVETDWAVATFTMNWAFTRPGILLRFEAGEAFCHLFPVQRGLVERFAPKEASIDHNPELKRAHDQWSESRSSFNADLARPHSEARASGWQKSYFQGKATDGTPLAGEEHRTRLRVRPFGSS